jgi:hypothetical protein
MSSGRGIRREMIFTRWFIGTPLEGDRIARCFPTFQADLQLLGRSEEAVPRFHLYPAVMK